MTVEWVYPTPSRRSLVRWQWNEYVPPHLESEAITFLYTWKNDETAVSSIDPQRGSENLGPWHICTSPRSGLNGKWENRPYIPCILGEGISKEFCFAHSGVTLYYSHRIEWEWHHKVPKEISKEERFSWNLLPLLPTFFCAASIVPYASFFGCRGLAMGLSRATNAILNQSALSSLSMFCKNQYWEGF